MNDPEKIILNLGCNHTRLPNSIGVDVIKKEGYVDIVHDLNKYPYPFKDNYADEIHFYHVLEHLDDSIKALEELHRILKPGGRLYLRVPHFSSLYAWGDITHRKAFSIYAFDIFDSSRDYKKWGYTTALFIIIKRQIRYFYTWPNEDWYMKYIVKPDWPKFTGIILKPWILLLNYLINLSPELFERFWCYWVGGAAEIYLIMDAVKHEAE
jgi:SAM-dependent methyltransferase